MVARVISVAFVVTLIVVIWIALIILDAHDRRITALERKEAQRQRRPSER